MTTCNLTVIHGAVCFIFMFNYYFHFQHPESDHLLLCELFIIDHFSICFAMKGSLHHQFGFSKPVYSNSVT